MPINDVITGSSLKINVVVQFSTGEYFARYQPDAGLTIDPKYLILDKATIAKAILDLRDVKTSIPTDSFTLLDKDYVATEFLLAQENKYLNTEVSVYIGISDANFNWSEYFLISKAYIKEIKRDTNGYNISLRRTVELTSKPLYYIYNSLRIDMTQIDNFIPLVDSSFFPASGMIKVNEEIITYSGKDASNNLTGLTRGLYSSRNSSTKVTTHGAAGNSLDGHYFLINTPTLSFAIWYRSSSGIAPGAYPNNIQVNIPSNASANQIAAATEAAINAGVDFSATSSGEDVIITSVVPGVTAPAVDFDTGFQFHSVNLSIADHRIGEDVYSIKLLEANPINALLQLMISGSGVGSPYDVLDYGLAIDPININIAEIETIRDTYYPADVYRFYISQVSSGQEFFEKEICLPTNTRMINSEGRITLVYIDQSTVYDHIVDESVTIGIPDWAVSVDKVINNIVINYDFRPGIENFQTVTVFKDDPSIVKYGKKDYIYSFKGIFSDLNGPTIIDKIGASFLIRLKDPRIKITANTFFSSMNYRLGQTVKLRHRYVPGATSMGADTDMTILEKGIDFSKGTVSLGLYYTTISLSSIKRFGIIGPSEVITNVLSQRTFTVEVGTWFGVGYVIRIDNETRTIRILNGNIITVNLAFTTPVTVGKLVFLAEYNLNNQAAQDRYAFTSVTGGNFADGELPYQIIGPVSNVIP